MASSPNKDPAFEDKLEINENLYNSFLQNIDSIKEVIDNSEQTYERTNDERIKEISGRTIKTAKKYLTELEKREPQVTKQYKETKRKIESLR